MKTLLILLLTTAAALPDIRVWYRDGNNKYIQIGTRFVSSGDGDVYFESYEKAYNYLHDLHPLPKPTQPPPTPVHPMLLLLGPIPVGVQP